jgi:hypothetical protein
MCRRTGFIGLPAGQVWAVGTMGLLDTLSAEDIATVAVPDAGRSLVEADAAVVARLVVTSPTLRCSPLVERYSLSVVHSSLSVERGLNFAPMQGAARRSPSYLTTGRCAAAVGAEGW